MQGEVSKKFRGRKVYALPEGYHLPNEGYVRLPIILGLFPVSRSGFLQGVKEGRFPSPVKLGPRTTAWRVEDIRKLIEKVGMCGLD